MKKNYQKPTLQVVQLQQQTQLLQASSEYDVIAPGQPNDTPAAPIISNDFNSGDKKGDVIIWDETW